MPLLENLMIDIFNQDYNKKLIDIVFYINDSEANVKGKIQYLTTGEIPQYNSIAVIEKDFGNTEDTREGDRSHTYRVLVDVRNELLDMFEMSNKDVLIMIDSDTRLDKKFFTEMVDLVDDDKHIVFPKLSVDYGKGFLWNCMEIRNGKIQHKVAFFREDLTKVQILGGGCFVSDRKIIDEKVKFSFHEQGEFIGFSLDCINKNIDMWCCQKKLAYHDMIKN